MRRNRAGWARKTGDAGETFEKVIGWKETGEEAQRQRIPREKAKREAEAEGRRQRQRERWRKREMEMGSR